MHLYKQKIASVLYEQLRRPCSIQEVTGTPGLCFWEWEDPRCWQKVHTLYTLLFCRVGNEQSWEAAWHLEHRILWPSLSALLVQSYLAVSSGSTLVHTGHHVKHLAFGGVLKVGEVATKGWAVVLTITSIVIMPIHGCKPYQILPLRLREPGYINTICAQWEATEGVGQHDSLGGGHQSKTRVLQCYLGQDPYRQKKKVKLVQGSTGAFVFLRVPRKH